MTGQFADLFDPEEHGINYWAGIAVAVGLLVGFAVNAGQMIYDVLVDGVRYSVAGEPLTLGRMLARSLRYEASNAAGFGIVLVASATLVKRDLHLPFVAGILAVLWGIVMRITGIVDAPAFSPQPLVSGFVWAFLMLASLIVLYRLLRNKLIALSLGMAMGALLTMVINTIRYSNPLAYAAESGAAAVCTSFIVGVFLFAGIARHFSTRGMHFSEYGLATSPDGVAVLSPADATLGKTRPPLVTLLLMLVTLNLYAFGWIYKVIGEIRRRSPEATSVTPGKALGFLFIPVFNFFWALWLWLDIPRAIERMELADPPSGTYPQRWVITGCLVVCTVAGLIGAYLWFPAFYLNAVLLWTGVLLAQSSLNSHWQAHRTGEAAA